uniref:AT-rich interactive domain 4A n=1 Tax=Seriola dumerili TaxID=41447 RepID=A0A3B4T2S4_SERDU
MYVYPDVTDVCVCVCVCVFQAADEPAYLTVGTDVSAKYRGAFCEAKIKTVKRMVKVKVTLKGESTSQVVQDDQVKGPLRLMMSCDVTSSLGCLTNPLPVDLHTDCWTVITGVCLCVSVFDDGDEKTLRRTSLCLKGERHFAESETLDQLPADEENESSSSEDEEEDRRRLNDELLGKVCSIEDEEEPSSWYLALVVSPSCNDELVVKKDQCLVRSFSDSKFHTVARRHVHAVNSISIARSEFSSRRGFEAAQMFLRSREVPDVWKMDMSQILDSSSSDDEDDEEEKESDEEEEDEDEKKKKKLIKEELLILFELFLFKTSVCLSGTPINKPPVLGYKDLNLFKLFRLVYHLGGCHKIESGTVWKQVYMDLGIPVLNSAASYNVKTAYRKYLYGFEEYCRSACITFRTIHHNNPRPPTTLASQKTAGVELKEPSTPQVKAEPVDDKREEVESESESEKEEVKERQSSPRGRRRCVGSQLKVEREPSSRPEKRGGENSEEQREVRRRSNRRMDDSEKGSEEEEEDEDDDEEEEGERRRGDSEDEEDGDSVTGTKVRVKYGKGKTQKIYEAHIKKTDIDNGEQFYLVHYYGWNVSAHALKIIMTLSAGRSVSKTPSNEGRSNGKSSRTETSSNMANGDSKTLKLKNQLIHMKSPPPDKVNKMSPPPAATDKLKTSPEKQQQVSSPLPAAEEEDRCTPLSSPRAKGRRANVREAGSETPPRIPLCTPSPTTSPSHSTALSSPPRGVLKRQDEPMVVLCCLPTEHLPPECPAVDSDTDSATEEEEEAEEEAGLPEERSSVAIKRKAAEQRAADKKLRPDKRQEEAASPKTPAPTPKTAAGASPKPVPSPLRSERRSEGVVKTEDWPRPAEEVQREVSEERLAGGAMKEPEVRAQTPPLAPEAPGPSPAEELEPQIGPEALVCHEVDLDDPDEKEKPVSSSEHLLLMMREQQQAPPPLPHLLHASLPSPHTPHLPQTQVRPFLPAAAPSSTPCPEELHPARSTTEEERGAARGAQEGDSITCVNFDPSGQKRVMDCNSSPSAKKQKRNQKRPSTPGKVEKNGAGELTACDVRDDVTNGSHTGDGHSSGSFTQQKCVNLILTLQSTAVDKTKLKVHLLLWNELDSMSSTERISFLQDKLQEIRKYYMTLKSEVASIDRRRKRLKKKEREVSNTTASTSSGSSDTGMSPSSASPTQNTVAVECR